MSLICDIYLLNTIPKLRNVVMSHVARRQPAVGILIDQSHMPIRDTVNENQIHFEEAHQIDLDINQNKLSIKFIIDQPLTISVRLVYRFLRAGVATP